MEYSDYLKTKVLSVEKAGFDIEIDRLNNNLFPFQKALVKWAIRRGRAGIFADTGLGKTIILLEWANQIVKYTKKQVLVLAPLCVSQQTIKEGKKFNIPIRYLRNQIEQEGITITNYEMMDRFDFSKYVGLVLDESSIIKHQNSKTRQRLIELAKPVPYKLSLSATPAPNDFMELGSQAEFLGVMDASEMLAMFFVHDGGSTSKWRLKGHGKKSFWEWLSTWAMVVKKPSDIGFDDSGYNLPNLNMIEHIVESPAEEGELFPTVATRMLDRNKARRESIENRVKKCADIVNATDEQFIVWCHLNKESDKLTKVIKGAVEIRGTHDIGEKERRLMSFINGDTRVLVTKPKIAGFGLNLQHVHNMAFVGLSDSWEEFYQAIRREWRFGQKHEVNVHIVSAQSEGAVLRNIKRKEQQAQDMSNEMVVYMHDKMNQELYNVTETIKEYVTDSKSGENWISYLGDCVEVIKQIEDCSVDYTIFSPPFASLYSYTDDVRDMGNSKDDSDFFDHFSYLMPELYRITKEGRLVSFHCMNIPSTKVKDGYIGLRDFRGELIQAFVKAGFIYHSEVCIWKDPVTQMQRTKALGLLHKQLKKDSAMSRMALPDYIVTLRKPGENKAPISHDSEEYPVEIWQRVAEPIWKDIGPDKDPLVYPTWYDIDPSNTLNKCGARESDDEKHICVAEGSFVLTKEHGYIPIEDVSIGSNVLTHKNRWKPVIGKKCNGRHDTISISAQGVPGLSVTPQHLFFTKIAYGTHEKQNAMKSEPVWNRADTLLGSYINLPIAPTENNKEILSDKEWWIIGRWLGDGHRGGHKYSGKRKGIGQFLISCSHQEAPELIRILGKHAGHVAKITATQIALVNISKQMRAILNKCGKNASDKQVPPEAFILSVEQSLALLDGYLSADGHYVEKHDRYCASSISKKLLLGMAIIAQKAKGIVASVYAGRPDREGYIENRKVHMSQDWIFAFRNSEGYRKSGWIDINGSSWKKVRKIETSKKCYVWDLEVQDDASFVVEGAVVHNCPLQLDVIERCLNLWTNPGDIVFSPFGGIGSEGYQALKMGRKAILIELKRSYWESNCKNLANAKTKQLSLFDLPKKEDLDKMSQAGIEGAKAGEKLRDKYLKEVEPKKEETIITKQNKDVDVI